MQPLTKDRRANYQDVLDAPPHMVAEVIDGTLHTNPFPGSLQAFALSILLGRIGWAFTLGNDGPGGWWILNKPELHLGEDILVPDLAGWRRERIPTIPDTWFDVPRPDWVCEVLSPETRKIDLHQKRPIYAREGVPHLWLVDPLARGQEAFELRDGQWVLIASLKDDDTVSVPPFEAIAFSLDALWPDQSREPDARTESRRS